MPAASNGNPKLALAFLASGLISSGLLGLASQEMLRTGRNDFMGFYSTGKLAFSGQLYHPPAHHAVQYEQTGYHGRAWICVRFPYLALFFWPYSSLDYRVAWPTYLAVSLLAVGAFLLLWPSPEKLWILAVCAATLPLSASILNGQDVVFLLVWLALGFRLLSLDRPFLAGLAWSLLAAKPHLFLYFPLILLYRRQWRILGGFGSGGLALLVVSFLVGGAAWMPQLLEVLRIPDLHDTKQMPNLALLFGRGPVLSLVAAPALAAALWMLARRTSLPLALAASIPASILLASHVYISDLALLIPFVLYSWKEITAPAHRWLLTWYLLPFGTMLLVLGTPWAYSAPIGLLLLLGSAIAWPIRSALPPPSSPRPCPD